MQRTRFADTFSHDIVPACASAGIAAALTAVAIVVPYGAAVAVLIVAGFGTPVYRRVEQLFAGRPAGARVQTLVAIGAGAIVGVASIFGLLVLVFAQAPSTF